MNIYPLLGILFIIPSHPPTKFFQSNQSLKICLFFFYFFMFSVPFLYNIIKHTAESLLLSMKHLLRFISGSTESSRQQQLSKSDEKEFTSSIPAPSVCLVIFPVLGSGYKKSPSTIQTQLKSQQATPILCLQKYHRDLPVYYPPPSAR